MKTALQFLAGLTIFLIASTGVWAAYLANLTHEKRKASEDELLAKWTALEPRVKADSERWKDDPLFQPRDGGDAAPVVFAHVRWEKGLTRVPPPVPDELREKMWSYDGGWPEHVEELDLASADTSWLSGLSGAGYLDIEGQGSALQHAPFDPLLESLPNFIDLQNVAKVHLAKGLKAGDARPAARDIRELARLCLTTEILVGDMIGVALLGIESKVRDEAVRRGQDVSGWTAYSQEERMALRRVLWTSAAPYTMTATGSLAAWEPAVGRCTGLRESGGMAHYMRSFGEDVFAERYAVIGSAIEQSPCRLRRLREAWRTNDPSGRLPNDGSALCQAGEPRDSCGYPAIVVHMPGMRSFMAVTLATVAAPEWFRQYEKTP
jgi:hypothetical protein